MKKIKSIYIGLLILVILALTACKTKSFDEYVYKANTQIEHGDYDQAITNYSAALKLKDEATIKHNFEQTQYLKQADEFLKNGQLGKAMNTIQKVKNNANNLDAINQQATSLEKKTLETFLSEFNKISIEIFSQNTKKAKEHLQNINEWINESKEFNKLDEITKEIPILENKIKTSN